MEKSTSNEWWIDRAGGERKKKRSFNPGEENPLENLIHIRAWKWRFFFSSQVRKNIVPVLYLMCTYKTYVSISPLWTLMYVLMPPPLMVTACCSGWWWSSINGAGAGGKLRLILFRWLLLLLAEIKSLFEVDIFKEGHKKLIVRKLSAGLFWTAERIKTFRTHARIQKEKKANFAR